MVDTRTAASCRGCGTASLELLFDLGRVPSVNTFLLPEHLACERPAPLRVGWCRHCTLVQLMEIIPPAELFTSYQHLSSASQSNLAHLQELATLLKERFAIRDATRIVDVGSNDGSLLAQFHDRTRHLLGIDPAKNVAALAYERYGVDTLTTFLTPAIVPDVKNRFGAADLVLALNVVAHTPGVNELLRAIRELLAPDGTCVMEVVSVFDTMLKGEFDTVYHEHVYCFSLTALVDLCTRAGLTIIDVERIPAQGGSLRVTAKRADENPPVRASVGRLLTQEKEQGVTDLALYASVARRIESFKVLFRTHVDELKQSSGRVIGLGAPARGVVMLNYAQMTPRDMEAVIDDTPLKQGRLVPGAHMPVVPWDYLRDHPSSAFVVLSWNYAQEIEQKLRRYCRSGQLLIPFPEMIVRSL